MRVARKHLDWYLEGQGIVLDKPQRAELLNAEDPAAVLRLIPAIFGEPMREAA